MKNWKQYTLIVFMAFLVFTFIGCGDDNGNKDPCNCDPKNHLAIDENCGCGLADCDCTAKVYGYINGIPIYRLKIISDTQAIAAAGAAKDGYDGAIGAEVDLGNINTTKVGAIYLTLDKTACYIPEGADKNIIYLAHDMDVEDMAGYIVSFNIGHLNN